MDQSHVNEDVELLKKKIKELGSLGDNGQYSIPFGVLYDNTVDIFEVTLKLVYI